MRVAVTGAGGFLGPYVVLALAGRGAEVHAITGAPGETVHTPERAAVAVRADICDAAAVREAFSGADAVVHLAGPSSVAASFRDPARTVRIHAEGTAVVLEACRALGIENLVYVSSAEVYGRPLRPMVDEDHPLSARSPYGAAKICAEKLIEAHAHAYGLKAAVLRPFSVYGSRASPDSLLGRIVALARAGEPVALRDLRPVRDYCFVEDVAEAVALSCLQRTPGTFNLGTGIGTSVARVATAVLEVLGVDLPVVETRDRDRPGNSDIPELIADIRRAREVLGWEPKVTLAGGLRRMLVA